MLNLLSCHVGFRATRTESWSKGCRGCEGVRLFDLFMRYAEHSPPSPTHLPEAPQVGGSGLGFSSSASPWGGERGEETGPMFLDPSRV